jgi:hypothetical protein
MVGMYRSVARFWLDITSHFDFMSPCMSIFFEGSYTGMKPFTVGVTGHRVLARPEECSRTVADILEGVRNKARKNGICSMVLLSPLAEGADRLVACECLKFNNFSLECLLPLEIDEYLTDFKTDASRHEFMTLLSKSHKTRIMDKQQNRTASYKQVGQYVVDHCDLLLAIWDGRPPENEAGTAAIVHYARSVQKPLYWIDSEHPENITAERINE